MAPGLSGERHALAQQILTAKHHILVRRWRAALGELTCQARVGAISPVCSWMFDTAFSCLSKDHDKTEGGGRGALGEI
eukprot:11170502-Lingulodinium_polyedra.AAC.1